MPGNKTPRKKKPSKTQPKVSKRDTFIGEAKAIRRDCLQLLARTAGVRDLIVAAQRNPEIELDLEKINSLGNTLANDLNTLKGELDAINGRADKALEEITDKTDDITVMTVTVGIGTDYQNWQERFISVTVPLVEQITEMCAGQGEEQ